MHRSCSSDSMKSGEFSDQLRGCLLLKDDSDIWSLVNVACELQSSKNGYNF